MEYEPCLFVTSLMELKLDQATAFEWQRHIQGALKVARCSELLKFLDLLARASEFTTHEAIKRSAQSVPHKGDALQKLHTLPMQLVPAPYAVGKSILYTPAENLDCCHTTSASPQ